MIVKSKTPQKMMKIAKLQLVDEDRYIIIKMSSEGDIEMREILRDYASELV